MTAKQLHILVKMAAVDLGIDVPDDEEDRHSPALISRSVRNLAKEIANDQFREWAVALREVIDNKK